MNLFIESLNQWGDWFLDFASAMLWQAGLLIALIFALDFFLARKIRATVRYTFWLIVLIKLLLPPTLALPTGAAWWLRTVKPVMPVVATSTAVTYGSDSSPMAAVPASATSLPLPPVKLDGAGWCLLVASLVSVTLLFWLLGRWWQVAQIVRCAEDMEQLNPELKEKLILAQHLAGGRSSVRVKITEEQMSPAVCGLFRPVILLPRLLVERLSVEQLGAVLLHELNHLRRADVWVNCVQALLQIAYWWHPLVWLANTRIRWVREEAVDDAVMLALHQDAEIYAPTLLEVVKLAWRRPLLSLGLVGIMESRSALRHRIERLMDFRIPRKTGLTVASVGGLFVFSAIALPMGEAPIGTSVRATSSLPLAPISASSATASNPRRAIVLLKASIYRMTTAKFENLISGLSAHQGSSEQDAWWSVSPTQLAHLDDLLKNTSPINSPRIQTSSGMPASMGISNGTNSFKLDCLPVVQAEQIHLTVQGEVIAGDENPPATNQFHAEAITKNSEGLVVRMKNGNDPGADNYVVVMGVEHFFVPPDAKVTGRNDIMSVLNSVRLGKVSYHAMPLDAVVRDFNDKIAQHNPYGVNFDYDPKLNPVSITIDPPLTNALAGDVLTAIVAGAGRPIQYSIEDEGIEFSWKGQKTPTLYLRAFGITSPEFFFSQLRQETQLTDTNTATRYQAMRESLSRAGMDWESPPGQSLFYNDRLNLLFVKTTLRSMNIVERMVMRLGTFPRQIHIKARFFEAPEGTLARVPQFAGIAAKPDQQWMDILSNQNFKTTLHNLRANSGIENLAEPEVVTSFGRETQMRATQVITVITNFACQETITNGVRSNAIIPQVSPIETGPILDVISSLMPDGHTIHLNTTALWTDFLGYRHPTHPTRMAYTPSGEKVDVPVILPQFDLKKMTESMSLGDNQTLVLGGVISSKTFGMSDEVPVLGDIPLLGKLFQKNSQSVEKKELLVLITATIVDSAGNRVYPDDTLTVAQGSAAK